MLEIINKIKEIKALFDSAIFVDFIGSSLVVKAIVDVLNDGFDEIKFRQSKEEIYDILDKEDIVILGKYQESNEMEEWYVQPFYTKKNEQVICGATLTIIEQSVATFIDFGCIESDKVKEVNTSAIYNLYD